MMSKIYFEIKCKINIIIIILVYASFTDMLYTLHIMLLDYLLIVVPVGFIPCFIPN